MPDWLEVVKGDDYEAQLLKRYPHERAIAIQIAVERDRAVTNVLGAKAGADTVREATWTGWADAVLRATLWSFKGKDYLTAEDTEDIGKADPKVIEALTLKALENYILWAKESQPGPKGSTPTNPAESETVASS